MIQTINILAMPMDQLRERIYEEVESNQAMEILKDPVYVSSSDSDTHQRFLESVAQPAETLQEHLLVQLSEKDISENVRRSFYSFNPLNIPAYKTEDLIQRYYILALLFSRLVVSDSL